MVQLHRGVMHTCLYSVATLSLKQGVAQVQYLGAPSQRGRSGVGVSKPPSETLLGCTKGSTVNTMRSQRMRTKPLACGRTSCGTMHRAHLSVGVRT